MSLTINHQTNDISATSGSVTIGGAAVGGGGGGALELVTHTVTSSSATSVIFDNLNDDYVTYRLMMDWVLSSQQNSYPNLRFYDGSTALTNYTTHRSATNNQNTSSSQSEINLVYETSSYYFNSIVNIWGIGLTNKPIQVSAVTNSSTSANSLVDVGAYRAATNVTPDKIEIRATWSNIPAGARFTLYGLKSS